MTIKKDNANGFLEGGNGGKSSKRLLGIIMLISSLIFGLILGATALFFNISNAETCLEVLKYFMVGGCTLLGVGIFENNKLIK